VDRQRHVGPSVVIGALFQPLVVVLLAKSLKRKRVEHLNDVQPDTSIGDLVNELFRQRFDLRPS
jgi:hypothetical protein